MRDRRDHRAPTIESTTDVERDRLKIPHNDGAMKWASEPKTPGYSQSGPCPLFALSQSRHPHDFLVVEIDEVHLKVRLFTLRGARILQEDSSYKVYEDIRLI